MTGSPLRAPERRSVWGCPRITSRLVICSGTSGGPGQHADSAAASIRAIDRPRGRVSQACTSSGSDPRASRCSCPSAQEGASPRQPSPSVRLSGVVQPGRGLALHAIRQRRFPACSRSSCRRTGSSAPGHTGTIFATVEKTGRFEPGALITVEYLRLQAPLEPALMAGASDRELNELQARELSGKGFTGEVKKGPLGQFIAIRYSRPGLSGTDDHVVRSSFPIGTTMLPADLYRACPGGLKVQAVVRPRTHLVPPPASTGWYTIAADWLRGTNGPSLTR